MEDFEQLTENEKLHIFTPTANEIRSANGLKPSHVVSVFHTVGQTLLLQDCFRLPSIHSFDCESTVVLLVCGNDMRAYREQAL